MQTTSLLFVDNSRSLLRAIKQSLENLGFSYAFFSESASDALRILKQHKGKISHVISDWKMQKPDGITFLADIKKRHPRIDCTLLTGFRKDISPSAARELETKQIDVKDKTDVDTVWLAGLIGIEPPVEFQSEDDHPQAKPLKPKNISVEKKNDFLLEQRLRIEELESVVFQERRIIKEFTLDLVEDLKSIPDQELCNIVGSPETTVKDLVREIESLTPLGRKLINFDRAARRRLVSIRKQNRGRHDQ